MEINKLIEDSHKIAVDHGFWEAERNFGDVISLIHTELSEAYEEYRHHKSIDETYYKEDGKLCGIPSELADVIIRICDFAGGANIDLEKIIKEKLEYNKTRPYKHGKVN